MVRGSRQINCIYWCIIVLEDMALPDRPRISGICRCECDIVRTPICKISRRIIIKFVGIKRVFNIKRITVVHIKIIDCIVIISSHLIQLCSSPVADLQQLLLAFVFLALMAGVDVAGEQREPPAARPRMLHQLLRLLRKTRTEVTLYLCMTNCIPSTIKGY